MQRITREKIDETISKVATEVSKDICTILIDNINSYENNMDEIGEENMKKYSLYIATMNTALQMSVNIMKESLYHLLCDD